METHTPKGTPIVVLSGRNVKGSTMISAREERETQNAASGGVKRGSTGWWVRSQSNPRIQYWTDGARCTCPDWRQRQPVGGCKHMLSVDLWLDAQAGAALAAIDAAKATTTPAPTPVAAAAPVAQEALLAEQDCWLTCGHCGHQGAGVHDYTAWVGGRGNVTMTGCDNVVECDARWDQAHGFRYDPNLGLVVVTS